MRLHIMVFCGGESAEREVSLLSGARVAAALRSRGHTVSLCDIPTEYPPERYRKLAEYDAVFLALHGGDGENGKLQRALEKAGTRHYTGSEPVACARAMRKDVARAFAIRAGVPVARGCAWRGGTPPDLPYPIAVKPLCGGSSLGFRVLREREEWETVGDERPLLCEEYLSGREFTVGVLAGAALPVTEIRPVGGTYDYAHKYTAGAAKELCPAPLSDAAAAYLRGAAETMFKALGLRDFARLDFKEDANGTPCFLEANTLPGMTETSLLPLAARAAGMDYPELCERMVLPAAARKEKGTVDL